MALGQERGRHGGELEDRAHARGEALLRRRPPHERRAVRAPETWAHSPRHGGQVVHVLRRGRVGDPPVPQLDGLRIFRGKVEELPGGEHVITRVIINDAEGQYHGASIDESIALFCALVAREAGIPDEFYWERWLEKQRKRR